MTPAGRLGRSALLVPVDPADIRRVWAGWRAEPPPGVIDVVAGADSVLLVYDGPAPPAPPPPPDEALVGLARPRHRVLAVVYDGPDLPAVARLTGLTEGEVAAVHAAATYHVSFVGFSPGFAYLTGGDPRLDVPRLDRPRTAVPAGSVALAAGMTAVYPQTTPGGWRLIGRSDRVLFDPYSAEPALLAPGDLVRFEPRPRLGPVPAWTDPALLRNGAHRRLEVLDASGPVTVQDSGRPGWAHAGVPRAGAADRRSAQAANSLVANPPGAALLEVSLGGCRFRLADPATIAVTGAPGQLMVAGWPARTGRALPLPAGTEVLVGPAVPGVHRYVAVRGGIDAEPLLGSRSRDTLSGLGPPPLRPGDVLGVGAPVGAERPGDRAGRPGESAGRPGDRAGWPGEGSVVRVRATTGPGAASLGPDGLGALAGCEWQVTADSDRTGVRLAGSVLPGIGPTAPAGMVPGAVQLPPGGQPVILLRNHPATGGYPVVAVVDDEGVDVLSQCRPGVRVRLDVL